MTSDPPRPGLTADGPQQPDPGRQAVVVVNFRSHELVEANLHASTDALDAVAVVLVVDNYSTAAERAAMADVCRRRGWHLVPQAENVGFGAGCNAGIREAVALGITSVLLVNPDAVVTGEVARGLHDQVVAEPMTLVAPRIVTSDGQPYFHGIELDLRSGRMRRSSLPDRLEKRYLESHDGRRNWLTGACLAFSVELWEAAGGWDEGYFLYWEDVDFSHRCERAGARLCIRYDLEVVHDEGATHGAQRSRARSAVYYYYNCRNRLLYARRHLGRSDRFRWVLRTPAESRQILLRGGRRQLLESSAPLRAAVSGSVAGLLTMVDPPSARRALRPGRAEP